MKRLISILTALYLIAGCSSGAGVSTTGGGITVSAGGLLITGHLSANGSISQDVIIDVCEPASIDPDTGKVTEAVLEDGLTTMLGTFTITSQDILDATGGLFPSGLVINTYTVQYQSQFSQAPILTTRTQHSTLAIASGNVTASTIVTLIDLGFTVKEFQQKTTAGDEAAENRG